MDDEVDIPIINDIQQALDFKGPFKFYPWFYSRIKLKEIPENKWYLFHDMLLREKSIMWSIQNETDVQFISKVIREHKGPEQTDLDFYTDLDKENSEQLATAIQSSRIRAIFLRKDHDLVVDLSPILRALRHSSTIEELKIVFEPTKDECFALADALQNQHSLKRFFALKDSAQPEFWPLLTPILMNHKSLRTLEVCALEGQCQNLRKILAANTVLKTLKLMPDEELSTEEMTHLISGLKANTTLKSLCLTQGSEGEALGLLFETLANSQINISKLELSLDEISGHNTMILSNSMKTNTCLTKLWMFLKVNNCKDLAEGLKFNTTLKSLRTRLYTEDIEGLKALCNTLKTTNSLTELNLSDSQFQTDHFKLIADMTLYNTSLTNLWLFGTRLTDEGMKIICDAMTKNKTIRELNVGNFPRKIYGIEGLKCVADMIRINTTLRKLQVEGNCEEKTNLDVVCDALKHNDKLTSIKLGGIFDDTIIMFENRIVELLQCNYALTTIYPDNGRTNKVRSLLKRNNRLKSEARFKVAILSHNIARSHQALVTLPREIWVSILSSVTHPGVDDNQLSGIVKQVFDSYN